MAKWPQSLLPALRAYRPEGRAYASEITMVLVNLFSQGSQKIGNFLYK